MKDFAGALEGRQRGEAESGEGVGPPSQDHHRTLGIAILKGLRSALFLMSEVPLYQDHHRTLGIAILKGFRSALFLMSEVPLYQR
jgi:hypothetical protein